MHIEPFTVRLPLGFRQRIRASAEINRRSMNAEIVYHLERALGAPEEGAAEDTTSPRLCHDNSLKGKLDEWSTD